MATSPFAFPLGVPIFRWFDNNGLPAASYQLQTYVAGTATPLATYPTYADAIAGTNPNTNPVVLDANGAAQVWVQAAFYKLVMMLPVAAGGATVYTQDNVPVAMGYPQPYPTEWIGETNPVAFISTTSFQITGVDVTAAYHTGRRVKVQVTAGTRYGTVRNSSFAVNTSVNIDIDQGLTLDAGLSAVSYGWNSWANPSYLAPRTAFSAIKNGTQTGFAASTKITAWTVQQDPLSEWDAGNNRWVPKTAGKYLVTFQCEFADTGVAQAVTPQIALTGAIVSQAASRSAATGGNVESRTVHHLANMTIGGATNYIEAFLLGTANTTVQNTTGTRLTIVSVP